MKIEFKEYLAKIDAIVTAKVGLSYLDLPDVAYYDFYEDGVSPARAAAKAIKAAKADFY